MLTVSTSVYIIMDILYIDYLVEFYSHISSLFPSAGFIHTIL